MEWQQVNKFADLEYICFFVWNSFWYNEKRTFLILKYSYQHCITGKKNNFFVVLLIVIRCHYHSSVFLKTILGKHLKIRRRHLHVLYKKKNALAKLKMFKEMWNLASVNLTFDFIKTMLHHGHIIAECFDFLGETYFTK